MRSYRELRVWRAAHQLTLDVYRDTATFPRSELFGLTSQMQRAAVSIASNVAEGSVKGESEFARFLQISLGSAVELDYQLLLARDLGYLGNERYDEMERRLESVKRMLVIFRRALLKSPTQQPQEEA